MAIDYEKLLNWPVPEVVHTYTKRDVMLYALGIGLGGDPVDRGQLRYVYELDLVAMPSMAVVLGYPGFWVKDPGTGVDWKRVVHGEQSLRILKPLPIEGTVVGKTKVEAIIDKGAGKGAIIYARRDISDQASGEVLATVSMSTFCRGDGGFGGPTGPSPKPHAPPERPPDLSCDLATIQQAALLYRLNGDYNPLHADPEVAKAAGFDRPILHGLCTFGVATHAILRSCCDYDPHALHAIDARFSAPVYPGETIRTEIWREADGVSFRARAVERDVVVLNNGRAELA